MIWNTFPHFLMYHPVFFKCMYVHSYVKMLERKKIFFWKVGSIGIRTHDLHVTGKASKITTEFTVRDSTQETMETQFQNCPKIERS